MAGVQRGSRAYRSYLQGSTFVADVCGSRLQEVVAAGVACEAIMARTFFGNERYDCVLEYVIKPLPA